VSARMIPPRYKGAVRRHPVLVTAALAVLLPSCGGDGAASGPGGATGPAGVVAALCDAERQAVDGDVEAAGATFQDRAHTALHQVAADLQERNATLAGQVLEAKQGVEQALAQGVDGETLAARLSGLNGVLQASLAATGTPVGGCA